MRRLQQRQFTTYSELISVLLIAEQTNQLLLKNHDLRPTSAKAIPDVNANENRNTSRFKGHGRGSRRGSQMDNSRPAHNNNKPQQKNTHAPNQNKGKKPMQKHENDNAYNRCGLTRHQSRACCTPKHFVKLYQASIKGKGKKVESHSVDNTDDIETNNALVLHTTPVNEVQIAPVEAKSLEILNFLKDQKEKAQNLEW